MRANTSVSTFLILLYTVKDLGVNICPSVCIQISHVQTCSSLNEVKQYVVRGSIGLADTQGAGTPLTQGQDIPLTGVRREAGRGGRDEQTERRRAKETLQLFLSLSASSLPSLWGCERAEQKERRNVRETKGGGQGWKDESNCECVSDSVFNMLCHAGVITAASSSGVVGCQEMECFPEEWVSEPIHHVDVGQ